MSDTTQYEIGAKVNCLEEPCGQLVRVVVDPVAKRLTHLVVDPGQGRGRERLVPLELVDVAASQPQDVRLSCDQGGFEALDAAEETEFLPGVEGMGYQPEQMVVWPFYGLGAGGVGIIDNGMMSPLDSGPVVRDRVPAGEVQIRRGDRIEAEDGEIGQVKGLVVDPQDRSVTHVLLAEGHLWGRKTVAIPIGTVTWSGGEVRTGLTKKELGGLPAVDFDDHG
jgi:hypothetical protein